MNLIDRLLINEDDRDRQAIANELSEMGTEGVNLILDALKSDRDLRVLLITLARIISKEKNRNHLINYYKRLDYTPLIEYAKKEDAKVRKNAYIIMGEIQDDIILSTLLEALSNERTYFNLPSILLALGNIGNSSIIDIINKSVEEILQLQISEKHKKEILKAHNKCIDKLSGERDNHTFIGLDKDIRIVLTTMQGKAKILLEEARAYYPKAKLSGSNVEIITNDYSKISNIRTFYDCYIAPSQLENIPLDMEIIGKTLNNHLSYNFIDSLHKGNGKYRYRIEISGVEDRVKMIDNFIYTINEIYTGNLQNSASNYEIEFRIVVNGDKCNIYLKLFTLEDKRFYYRINDIPASIKGENAAMVIRLVKHHLRDGASVFDPFVGTGTMLIERQLFGNTSSLTGMDISKVTIEKAKQNLNAAKIKANLINMDILRFRNIRKYDEIISNMPYGLRVSTHKNNERLYSAFMERIPQLLNPNGRVILLTADYMLLKQVAKSANLKLIDEYVINNGGLYPRVLVYRSVSNLPLKN